MEDLFEYKDCFTPLNSVESIPIFVNSILGCKYTIAIPTYNRAHDLKQALDSAIEQDFQGDYNILVVDNNPERNDETETLMLAYRNNKKISYYKNCCNVGMIDNWNKLFMLSETEFVIMLHDDDMIFANYLSEMDSIVNKRNKIAAVNVGKKLWDGNTLPCSKELLSGYPIKAYRYSKYSNFAYFHFGAPSGCLFQKSAVVKEGGFDKSGYPSSDYILIQKLSLAGYDVFQTKEEYMLYRVGTNTTAKPETAIAWLEVDSCIKEQLGKILGIPELLVKLVKYFELKLRIRAINKSNQSYKYGAYTGGGNIFLVFYNLYYHLYRLMFIPIEKI